MRACRLVKSDITLFVGNPLFLPPLFHCLTSDISVCQKSTFLQVKLLLTCFPLLFQSITWVLFVLVLSSLCLTMNQSYILLALLSFNIAGIKFYPADVCVIQLTNASSIILTVY